MTDALSIPEAFALVQRHGAGPGPDRAAVAGAQNESGLVPDARGDYEPGYGYHSWGLWQMHDAGEGTGWSIAARCDPEQAAAHMVPLYVAHWTAAGDALGEEDRATYAYIQTEKPEGFPALDCPAALRFRAHWQAVGQATPGARTYDPAYGTPAYQQHQDWVCSICATAWALGSLGYPATAAGLQDPMVGAGLVTAASGLLAGNGSWLETWLQGTYGLTTERASPATWEWVQAHAGRGPLLLGGGAWNHWVGARRALDADTLALANSADGYDGVHQTLTRAQFAALGPFAAIYLAADATQEEDAVTQAEYDALKTQYDDLNNYASGLGHDILKPTVAELRALRADPKVTKAQLVDKLEAVADRLQPYVVD